MMTHAQARHIFSTARNPEAGKPLENNTRLHKRGNDYAVRLHSTDVVTIHANGTYTLNTGGWHTATPKARINDYSPARAYQLGTSALLCRSLTVFELTPTAARL
jgi:hypothetical protein